MVRKWTENRKSINRVLYGTTIQCASQHQEMRGAEFPDIEKAVDIWFKQARGTNVPINGPLIQARNDKYELFLIFCN